MLRDTFVLSETGFTVFKKGILACVVSNLTLMAPVSVLFLASEMYVQHIFDAKQPLPDLLGFLVAIAAVLVAMFITQYLEYNLSYVAVYGESARKRISLSEHLRKLPLSFFGQRDLTDLTSIILKDCSDQERMFSHIMPRLFAVGITTGIIAIMLFIYHWELALAALWPVPLAILILLSTQKISGKKIQHKNACHLAMLDKLQEYIECNRELRSSNTNETYQTKLFNEIDNYEQARISLEYTFGVPVTSTTAFLRLGMASTVLLGSLLVISNQISLMVLFAFLLVVTRVYDPISVILAAIAELNDMKYSLNRMRELENHPTQEGSAHFEPSGHDICFEHVSFAYNKGTGTQVLDDISFTAPEGQVTALVGPSGSGKSTVAKLAARFWDIQSGTVRMGGVDISQIDPEVLLGHYSMVFQDVVLFDTSIMENIRIGKKDASDDEVRAAAAAAMCDEFALRLPDGYNTRIGENGSQLSGGERQRISIARALLKDAPIVLLDEATASLDVENETHVQEALSRLLAGKTVLVIAHRMRTVEHADKIVVLSDGTVSEQGSPQELLEQHGLFAHMVHLQKKSASWTL
ncbi:ABC transporter ATP-binding protein/permease [Collinsella sp. zg1085]|uniref:ABC transporter ATP-binding protein n=1 Tax=Collinsella sp. zg1085 TaxID=2844380 RepID=UPI001C0E5EF9|nr:ABC transporter ATP-binding protein/permease [Collinsella sp. zg1085]